MVDFLIKRPIGVSMVFISILMLGAVSLGKIPIALMPDIDVPEVTVQVSSVNTSARELENTVIKPLRRQLLQTSHLSTINSETQDEQGTITLRFEYGTDADYAFIEVNEKIDQALTTLPSSLERPRARKSSAADLPVFYLNLTLKPSKAPINKTKNTRSDFVGSDLSAFIQMSRFAERVIRRRIEQLPEVALVDISGTIHSQILIVPDLAKIEALKISIQDIEASIKKNNIKLGNLLIKDGLYEYNVIVDSEIENIRHLQNLIIRNEEQSFKLSELAQIIEQPKTRKGMVSMSSQEAVTLAIIQQGDAQMRSLKKSLEDLIQRMQKDYSAIQFEITQDQSEILDYSISSLRNSLIWGITLAFLIIFFFMRDFRSPFLIGISVPVAVLVTLLAFHLTGISINIISLSGLILGVGLMIDNSIIVIDNITQYRERGLPLRKACVKGTVEVFKPLLSSALTTCAVFVPLIFLSGIAGTLFYDQAMAVSLGLGISLAVSITLLPVYYALFYKRERELRLDRVVHRMNTLNYEGLYDKGLRWVMRHQGYSWVVFIGLLACTIVLYQFVPKQQLPDTSRDDFILKVDWNERINLDENRKRTDEMILHFQDHLKQNVSLIGQQQFILKNEGKNSSEMSVYLRALNPTLVDGLKRQLSTFLSGKYPQCIFQFEQSTNVFDLIFAQKEAPLIARLNFSNNLGKESNATLSTIHQYISNQYPELEIEPIAWEEQLKLVIDVEQITQYQIPRDEIITTLKQAFNEHEVLLITSGQEFIPVLIGYGSHSISHVIENLFLTSTTGKKYPVRELLKSQKVYDLKTITAGGDGEFFSVKFEVNEQKADMIMEDLTSFLSDFKNINITFGGNIFKRKILIKEMIGVLGISLLLLYFILAAQFESISIPLIVLLEVPIDLAGSFLMLHFFDSSINLMSMIGMVVMSGIIINDSILKIDTINQLRKTEHMPLLKALLVAGQRRLKPIVMTSLTTILALIPTLFSSGLGVDLQKPLALAVIGGMILGVVVSLYFIPLCYYYLVKYLKS